MKLTIEHLKGYLGTGLKIKDLGRGIIELNINELFYYNNTIGLDKIKPILHPLSDLTKEQMNRLNNLSCDKNKKVENLSDLSFFYGNATDLEEIKDVFEYLYKNHFDVHGLIEQGLAIDINTLTK